MRSVPSRVVTKPGRSRISTVSLPSAWQKSSARPSVAALVSTELTTSTSRIAGTGLKKCVPTTWPGRSLAAPSTSIGSPLVFDARTASSPAARPSVVKMLRFRPRSSETASITMSACAAATGRSIVRSSDPNPGSSAPFDRARDS